MTYQLIDHPAVIICLVVGVMCFLDKNVLPFLWLKVLEAELAVERFFFRLKLEKDLLMIKFSGRKYRRMAKELLNDLKNE